MTQPTWPTDSAGPELLQKYANEDRVFLFDFTDSSEFESGITAVSAVVSVIPAPSILLAQVVSVDQSGTVFVRLGSGSGGTTYLLECDLTLSDGSVLSALGQLLVINPANFIIPAPPPPNQTTPPALEVTNPLTVDLIANGHQLRSLGAPTQDGDAATKKYVDDFLVYGDSTTVADGATRTFAFNPPIGQVVCGFIGGIPQLAPDCSVDGLGQLVFADNVSAPDPTFPVTALYIRQPA